MTPVFFKDQSAFRKWLEENHTKEKELVVGYYKVSTGKPSINWSESVDQAICFGWIDGIRKSIDNESYCIRFTPRKPSSNWSAVNIRKVENLIKNGQMTAAGLEAYKNIKENKSGIYSFENEAKNLPVDFETTFKVNKTAWEFFNKQTPSYRKAVIHWILSAKQEVTKLSRFEKLLSACEKQTKIY